VEDATVTVALFCTEVHAPAVQARLPMTFAMACYGPRDEQRVLTAKLTYAEWTHALATVVSLGMRGLILDVKVWQQGEEMPQELLPPGHPNDPDLPFCGTGASAHFSFRGSPEASGASPLRR